MGPTMSTLDDRPLVGAWINPDEFAAVPALARVELLRTDGHAAALHMIGAPFHIASVAVNPNPSSSEF